VRGEISKISASDAGAGPLLWTGAADGSGPGEQGAW
jgi:hypothetical protein